MKRGGNHPPNDGFGHMSAVRCRHWVTRRCNPHISRALYPNTKHLNHADTKSAPSARANGHGRNPRILGPKHRCRRPRRNFLKSPGNKPRTRTIRGASFPGSHFVLGFEHIFRRGLAACWGPFGANLGEFGGVAAKIVGTEMLKVGRNRPIRNHFQ